MGKRASLSGRNVLIVEDQYVIALDLRDLLRSEGCGVVGPASTADEARALLREHPVDIALVNVSIQDGESFPIARELRAGGVPFVFVTGFDDLDHIAPDDFKDASVIQKPFSGDDVLNTLARLVHDEREGVGG